MLLCVPLLGGQQFMINEALKNGAKDFIVKPYFHNLVAIVTKHC